jgi:SAM-dependent methyltransferase
MPSSDHFSRVAAEYAICRPSYPPELFSYLSAISLQHDLAWDCAAGSGQATLPLARFYHRVLGTDISPAMLARAPRHPAIEYRVSPAEDSGLDDGAVDLITVAQALHWLDLNLFYTEVGRVLRPGGVLSVWSYATLLLDDERIDAILSHFYNDVVGPYWPSERRHVEAGYRTLPFPYDRFTVPELNMQERWTLDQLVGYVATWSATQRFREVQKADPTVQLAEELIGAWGDPTSARWVRWPLSLGVGRKPS